MVAIVTNSTALVVHQIRMKAARRIFVAEKDGARAEAFAHEPRGICLFAAKELRVELGEIAVFIK